MTKKKHYNVGRNHPRWKGGWKYYCVDCGKKISFGCKRCRECEDKHRVGSNSPSWKGGWRNKLPKCIDCGKQLTNPHNVRCHSCDTKNRWLNLEYKEKVIKSTLKGLKLKPNKKEKLLNKLLNEWLPKEYEFVGNGKVVFGGFCPDFINVNGQKKIIELYGDYWHNKLEVRNRDKKRREIYKRFGYKTLIVWEKELKNLTKLKNKILEFTL